MKKLLIILIAGVTFGSFGVDIYNFADAVNAASAAEYLDTTGYYTDAIGGKWRFGTVEKTDVTTISSFEATAAENYCNGYTTTTPSMKNLPFIYANPSTSTSSRTVQGIETLMPGWVVMHPQDVGTPHPCVAMELTVAKAGKYTVILDAFDGNTAGTGSGFTDGVLLGVYGGGEECHKWAVNGETGSSTIDKVFDIELSPAVPMTIVLDPNLAHSHDTTVMSIKVIENADEDFINVDDKVFGEYPNAVSVKDISKARTFKAKEDGIYDIAILATGMEYADGATKSEPLITLYRNDVRQLESYCAPDDDFGGVRLGAGFYLKKGERISFAINDALCAKAPLCRAILTEVMKVKGEPIIDLNSLYYDIINEEGATLPYTDRATGVTVSSGLVSNNQSWFAEYEQYTSTRYSYTGTGSYTGFARTNGTFPWTLINNSTEMGPVNEQFGDSPTLPKEIIMHPENGDDFIKCTVPTGCYVQSVMIARDLKGGGGDGVSAYVTADWNYDDGKGLWSVTSEGVASQETGPMSRVIVSDPLDFRDLNNAACFAVNKLTSNGCDSTAVQAFVFVDSTPDTLINVDIDGHQAADVAPVTYTGYGAIKENAGAYWNAFYHDEKTENDITLSGLKTSKEGASDVTFRFKSRDGSMIGFDNNGAGSDTKAIAAFKMDYLYLYNQYVDVTISNLQRGHLYDLYVYGTQNGNSVASFGGVELNDSASSSIEIKELDCAAMHFANLKPDAEGKITGWIYGTTGAGVFPGFQFVDVTPPKDVNPLAIIVR